MSHHLLWVQVMPSLLIQLQGRNATLLSIRAVNELFSPAWHLGCVKNRSSEADMLSAYYVELGIIQVKHAFVVLPLFHPM